MKRSTRFANALLFAIAALPVIQGQAAVERIGDFALLDEQGSFHQLSRYQHRDAVVLLAYEQDCSGANNAVQALAALQDEYGDRIAFLALDVSGAARSERQQWQLPFPVLGDELTLVSESLGIAAAGEVLVFNPARMSLFYRGGAEAALDATLAAVLDDSISDTVTSAVSGCQIDYADLARHKETPPDYTTEVAPIIVKNCAICHRSGGTGPFPFDEYVSLLGWSPMVEEVVLNKRMPPMQVDPEIGHSPVAHYFSAEDRQTLLHWIKAGAPRGDGELDPLEELAATEFTWQLGEPDFIVQPPTNIVPAVGIEEYRYQIATLPFTEDKWVRAFQYSPGDTRILHHLMAFVVPPGEDFWGPEKTLNTSERRFLGSFIPGENPATVYPEDTGVRIPAGHELALQYHYVTNGVQIQDKTSIALYFSDTPPAHEILTRPVSERFVIAPGDPEHRLSASFRFEERVQLLAVRARMNYRGKYMKFSAEHPDRGNEALFSIPAYNYGWQPHYWLDGPRTLESGSTVVVEGAFDNSLSNPFNPDPREEVQWGLESKHEMFTGYLTYYVDE